MNRLCAVGDLLLLIRLPVRQPPTTAADALWAGVPVPHFVRGEIRLRARVGQRTFTAHDEVGRASLG